jgi:1-acyl-sn-glycerol-3-phosphate acyltransferase
MWIASTTLIVVWYPAVLVRKLFDRDPVRYASGRLFRNLGLVITRINPLWKVEVVGAERILNPRNPYVVVSNHQSFADVPILSHLPWEMKWMAKKELFSIPFLGWQLTLAGDIPVDRENPRASVLSIRKARAYLEQNCSVMVFAEGTRSPDGNVQAFLDGAFRLAIDSGVPILPIVVDGTFNCLPKNSWRFGKATEIKVEVLDPVATEGMNRDDIDTLRELVRGKIADRISQLRAEVAKAVEA